MSQHRNSFDDGAVQHADLALARWRAEVELLAATAAEPRRSGPVLAECQITLRSFANLDTAAIFLAIQAAARPVGPPDDVVTIAARARRLLQTVDCWRDCDDRTFIAGGAGWSAPAVIALLSRVRFDPALIRAKAAALQAIDRRQLTVIDQLRLADPGASPSEGAAA